MNCCFQMCWAQTRTRWAHSWSRMQKKTCCLLPWQGFPARKADYGVALWPVRPAGTHTERGGRYDRHFTKPYFAPGKRIIRHLRMELKKPPEYALKKKKHAPRCRKQRGACFAMKYLPAPFSDGAAGPVHTRKQNDFGGQGMQYHKVELCGVNTAKLPVLKEKENGGAAARCEKWRCRGAPENDQWKPAPCAERGAEIFLAAEKTWTICFRWAALA